MKDLYNAPKAEVIRFDNDGTSGTDLVEESGFSDPFMLPNDDLMDVAPDIY